MSAALPRSPVVQSDVAEIIAADLPWQALSGRTVLVTGASGMLPAYAVLTLLGLNDSRDAGISVLALVRNEDKARRILGPVLAREDVRLLVQDVAADLDIEGPVDYVVHGASAARPSLHASDPVGTIRANLVGTFNLLQLCVDKGSAGFVLMSSAEVYGQQPEGTTLIDEDSYGGLDILNPRACYSEGKRAAETIAAVYAAQYGVRSYLTRFGHVYGPGLALDDGRVQADFAAKVVSGNDIVLNSDGSATRTYTYVADAISGMFTVLLKGEPTAYNVADSAALVSIRDLAALFVGVRPDKDLKLRFTSSADERRYSQSKGQGLSNARLTALGWEPRVDLPTGLDRMVTNYEWELREGS